MGGEPVEESLDALEVPAPAAGGVGPAEGEGLGGEAEDLVEEGAGGVAVGVGGGERARGGVRAGLAETVGEVAPAAALLADVAEPGGLVGAPAGEGRRAWPLALRRQNDS